MLNQPLIFTLPVVLTVAFACSNLCNAQPTQRNYQPGKKFAASNQFGRLLGKPGYVPPQLQSATTASPDRRAHSIYPRMIAEFEPQRAIMLSVSDLQPHHSHVLKQIVAKSAGYADILILYNDNFQLKKTIALLNDTPHTHVSFYRLELDTVWLRDFGPRISQDKDGFRSLDFYYYGVRPLDDSFPERWSLKTAGRITKIPWTLQGGNLLCNGNGLGLTTRKLFEDNQVSFGSNRRTGEGEQFVIKEMKEFCNLNELIVLEPLRNESTKHVDMFAAFLAPDHVLLADVDTRIDAANARILDWNARKLANTTMNGTPLKISRIKIPPRDGNAWSTYTNAILTDRLVLVPTMNSDGSNYIANAVSTYKKLLPNHHVVTVDISSMKKLQGSLHCMSLNLPASAPLPNGTISFDQAMLIASRTPNRPKQKTPAKAFPMHKQLRRVFKSSSSDDLVDAYAVNIVGDVATLLLADSKKLIRLRIKGVCKADQYWLQRNTDKIRSNGQRVKQLILSNSKS